MKTILLLMTIICISINGQEDTLKHYNLGEVVVTSEQSGLVKSSSVFDVNLMTIENYDNKDITSPLKYFAGLHITTTSKNESKIYMRGYDQRQVAVFLDGVPIYEPYSGMIDLSNLPVSSIEKITVSKGMPSLAYGANSMGGTINFVTKSSQEQKMSLNIESGSSHNLAIGTSGGIGNFYYNIHAGYTKSSGYEIPSTNENYRNENGGIRDNSQYENLGGMIKLGVNNLYNFSIAYSLMIIDNQKGVPTDVYTKNPRYWRYTEWKKTTNNLMFSRTFGNTVRIKGNLFYDTYKNVLDSHDDATFTTQTMRYAFRSTYDDHSIGLNLISDFDVLKLGITRLSFAWKKDVHKEEGNFNEGFSSYEASVMSTGIEQDINLSKRIFAVVGLGYDLLTPIYANEGELRENSSSLNGFMGISYRATEDLSIHINGSKKSRFPTLKEFYSQTAGRDLANPNLEIEKSINSELGFVYQHTSEIMINGSLFYNSIDDLINLVFLEGGLRQYQNIGKAEMKGAEIAFRYIGKNISVNLAYTYLDAKNVSENRESDILEYRPEHVLSLTADYGFTFGTTIRGELVYTANKYGVDSDKREFVKMENVMTTNIRISQQLFENYLVYLRANNIFNTYYESEYGFPQAGRELFIGLRMSL
ncbi:tonb-dependent receptor [hydrocarbon metagenome]|uniref:Tonb-dependent receptor n=1 Tax=hydrocarbon metagenome TaxID=938273 RepID=A0A0W8G152_9ZZZZ